MSGSRRILVVDDDESIRQFMEMALADRGYEVSTAADGSAALDIIARVELDLIFLDMRMPVMDGWAFSTTYRAAPVEHAPIVVLTAARDAQEFAAQIGADAFLAKPFDLRELLLLADRFAPLR